MERSDLMIYMRNFKISAHLLYLQIFQLNWREFKDNNASSQNFEIPEYKEKLMRTL